MEDNFNSQPIFYACHFEAHAISGHLHANTISTHYYYLLKLTTTSVYCKQSGILTYMVSLALFAGSYMLLSGTVPGFSTKQLKTVTWWPLASFSADRVTPLVCRKAHQEQTQSLLQFSNSMKVSQTSSLYFSLVVSLFILFSGSWWY